MMEDYDQAIADFGNAIRIDPDSAAGYNSRGIAYYKKGVYTNAITDLTKAIEIYPEYAEAYYYRGLSNLSLEHTEEAIADFEKCIELSEDPELTAKAQQQLEALQTLP